MKLKFIFLVYLLQILSINVFAQESDVKTLIRSPLLGNCITCHQFPGEAGKQGNFAPSLIGVGKKYNLDQLKQWISDARVLNPNTLMPPFGSINGLSQPMVNQPVLTIEQINKIALELKTYN